MSVICYMYYIDMLILYRIYILRPVHLLRVSLFESLGQTFRETPYKIQRT